MLRAVLPPEERLAGLPPEQRLAGLSAEQIREYLNQLTAERPTAPASRDGRSDRAPGAMLSRPFRDRYCLPNDLGRESRREPLPIIVVALGSRRLSCFRGLAVIDNKKIAEEPRKHGTRFESHLQGEMLRIKANSSVPVEF